MPLLQEALGLQCGRGAEPERKPGHHGVFGAAAGGGVLCRWRRDAHGAEALGDLGRRGGMAQGPEMLAFFGNDNMTNHSG